MSYRPTTRKRPRMQAPKPDAPIRCEGHLSWVRKLQCVCASIDPTGCEGKGRACHVRIGTDGGTGMKPGDNWTFPACDGHHAEQHRIGERSFEQKYRFKLKQIAATAWHLSPHGQRYRREHHSEPDTGLPQPKTTPPGPPPSEHPNSARQSGRANSATHLNRDDQ